MGKEALVFVVLVDSYKHSLNRQTNGNDLVSASNAYKIIGNAVPCVLGYNIAQRLSENWTKYFL